MTVSEAIRTRRSIRVYEKRPVEEEKLMRVLDAGRLAPSARNMQEWKFVVVRDAERRRQLMRAAANQSFVAEAPVVVAACGTIEHRMRCGQLSYPIDVAIALDHMTLQAVEEGLGTCWVCAFDEEEVKRILEIPKEVRVVALLALGYPGESPRPRPRKAMEEVVCFEKYS